MISGLSLSTSALSAPVDTFDDKAAVASLACLVTMLRIAMAPEASPPPSPTTHALGTNNQSREGGAMNAGGLTGIGGRTRRTDRRLLIGTEPMERSDHS
jgi:hypothetical protein